MADFILPSSIGSEEAFGTLNVATIQLSAITSAETFGTIIIAKIISPTSITSAETFGTLGITLYILPNGIASAETFGSPNILRVISPTTIISTEAFGTLFLSQNIYLGTIESSESIGDLWVRNINIFSTLPLTQTTSIVIGPVFVPLMGKGCMALIYPESVCNTLGCTTENIDAQPAFLPATTTRQIFGECPDNPNNL